MRFSRSAMVPPSNKKARHRVKPGLFLISLMFQVSAAQRMFRELQRRLFGLEPGDIRLPIYFLNQILHLSLGEFVPIFWSIASTKRKTLGVGTGSQKNQLY